MALVTVFIPGYGSYTGEEGSQVFIPGYGTYIFPAAAGGHTLLANDVQSTSEVSSPAIGQSHALTATSVESASEVSNPVLAEASHDLFADDVQSTSEVSSPAIGQVHALLADDVQSTSEVSSPALAEAGHILFADDVQSTSEVSSPAIGQAHALVATDTQSVSSVSNPALGQVHALLADDIQSASEVSSPALTEAGHPLLADDVQSTSEVSSPAIGQAHVLAAGSIQSLSEISNPGIGQIHVLLADDVESSSEVSAPALGRSGEIWSGCAQPGDTVWGECAVDGGGGGIWTPVGSDELTATSIQSASEVSTPTLDRLDLPTCLSTDFAICPWTPLDFGIDEYRLHTGAARYSGGSNVLLSGDFYADGSKLEFDCSLPAIGLLKEYTLDGTFISDVLTSVGQDGGPGGTGSDFYITAAVQGEPRMWTCSAVSGIPQCGPTRPFSLWNRRDDDPGDYYRYNINGLSDTWDGSLPNMILGPDDKLYTLIGSFDPGPLSLARFPVPSGGPGGTGTDTFKEAVATDALLTNITYPAVVILSDDSRMFVFRDDTDTLIEFDTSLAVVDSWSFSSPANYLRVSTGAMIAPVPISADRIYFPFHAISNTEYILYELSSGGVITPVHEWTLPDLGSFQVSPGAQAIIGMPGIVFSQFHYITTGTPVTGTFNFIGTPDYTP